MHHKKYVKDGKENVHVDLGAWSVKTEALL